jgi:hypothetical protein
MPRLRLSEEFPSPHYNDARIVGWPVGTEMDVTDEHAAELLTLPYFSLVDAPVLNRAIKKAPVSKAASTDSE